MKLTMVCTICICITLLIGKSVVAAEFNSNVNRTELELGETLQLEFSYDAEARGATPDFSSLESNFNILSISPASQFVVVNGNRSVSNTWTLILEPKSRGKLLIPPISFMGDTAGAVEITVKEPGPIPSQLDDVMIDLRADKNEIYVGEEFKVSYLFSYAISIADYDFKQLKIDNAEVQALEHNQYQRKVGNKQFYVLEMPYLVRATSGKELIIPELLWKAQIRVGGVSRSIFDRGRYNELRLKSPEKRLILKPIPPSFPQGATWRAAKSLAITDNWSKNPKTLKIGEPVTRNITIKGKGISAAELPAILKEFADDNIKVYPEQAKLDNTVNGSSSLSSRSESAAIIMSSSTPVTLPGVRIPWWNVVKDKLEYAEIGNTDIAVLTPAKSVTNTQLAAEAEREKVQNNGAIKKPDAIGVAQFANTAQPLLWVLGTSNLVTLTLLLIFIYIYFKRPHTKASVPSSSSHASKTQEEENALWKKMQQAALANDPTLFLSHFRAWCLSKFGSLNIHSIANINGDDPKLRDQIDALLSYTYQKEDRGADLAIDLKYIVKSLKQADRDQQSGQSYTQSLVALN